MSIPEILREHRLALRLSQERLAEALGVHRKTIEAWERGRTEPKLSNVIKMGQLTTVPTALTAELEAFSRDWRGIPL